MAGQRGVQGAAGGTDGHLPQGVRPHASPDRCHTPRGAGDTQAPVTPTPRTPRRVLAGVTGAAGCGSTPAVTRALHSLTHFPQALAHRWSTRCRAVGAGTRPTPCPLSLWVCVIPGLPLGSCPSAGVTPWVPMCLGSLVPSNCPRGCVGVSVCMCADCPHVAVHMPPPLWFSGCPHVVFALAEVSLGCPHTVPSVYPQLGCPGGVPVRCPSCALSLCRDPAVPSGDPRHRQTGRG